MLLRYLSAHGTSAHLGAPETSRSFAWSLEATDWLMIRSRVCDWPFRMLTIGDAEATERMREIRSLFGSAGESFTVACAARTDDELLRLAGDHGEMDPLAILMRRRFWAEATLYYLFAVTNGLANVAIRSVLLLAPGNCPRRWKAIEPWSKSPTDWISATQIRALAQEPIDGPLGTFVGLVDELVGSESWRAAWAQRSDDFHRWRIESSPMPTMRPDDDVNPSVCGLGGDARQDPNQQAMESAIALADELLETIGVQLKPIRETWLAAVRVPPAHPCLVHP